MKLLALLALAAIAVANPISDAKSKFCRTLVDNKVLPDRLEDFVTIAFPVIQELCTLADVAYTNRYLLESWVRDTTEAIMKLTYENCMNTFMGHADVASVRKECNEQQRGV